MREVSEQPAEVVRLVILFALKVKRAAESLL
jgi:hypothetical protein